MDPIILMVNIRLHCCNVCFFIDPRPHIKCPVPINPKMDMQKIGTLDGFGVRADPGEHFVKNATLRVNLDKVQNVG